MRLSKNQRDELETIKYFIPSNVTYDAITDEDVERFFAWSDRGVGGLDVKGEAMQTSSGLSAMYWGKQRRDLQITSYIEDWGLHITSVDFKDEPEAIARYVAKVMKKPGIVEVWLLFNRPDDLTDAQRQRLHLDMAPFTLRPVEAPR